MFHPFGFAFLLCVPTVLSVPWLYSKVSESPDAERVVEVRVHVNATRNGKQVFGNATICSGVLLAEDIVATASHCRLSEWYKECDDNALLILEKNITVQTASPLYVYCGAVSDLKDCVGYGYGLTEHNAKSREVREAHYTVRRPPSNAYGSESCLIASYHSKAKMCNGDSGGPTICKFHGLSMLAGVGSQIYARVEGTAPEVKTVEQEVSFCKLTSAFLMTRTANMIRLLKEIPGGDRKYIMNRIHAWNCGLWD
ncbi:unnamed protein product [Bursaphelenchus xylophilus]|uniref:(pine wood nematode) hypothetical protein n=1 Tax=Bursaphelenchus xylophilus TaxID=6326 RepID=A0A7I8XJ97_BURXY|nr:unnamed protein product [Bursaphelenchus xylophilus]CAG9121167.1 unnamed protein product [Bursaphelenchus xylophilus]